MNSPPDFATPSVEESRCTIPTCFALPNPNPAAARVLSCVLTSQQQEQPAVGGLGQESGLLARGGDRGPTRPTQPTAQRSSPSAPTVGAPSSLALVISSRAGRGGGGVYLWPLCSALRSLPRPLSTAHPPALLCPPRRWRDFGCADVDGGAPPGRFPSTPPLIS